MRTLLLTALLLVPPLTSAMATAVDCPHLLSADQIAALESVNEQKDSSYEVFTAHLDGQTKVVALIGEPTHQGIWNTRAGVNLYEAFERTAFSFRHLFDFQDRLFGRLLAPVASGLFRFAAWWGPKEERGEYEFVRQLSVRYLKMERTPLKTPNLSSEAMQNDPFVVRESGRDFERFRFDLDNLRERRERGEALRTIDLERGFKPNWIDRARDYMFSLDLAALLALSYFDSHQGSLAQQIALTAAFFIPNTWLLNSGYVRKYNCRSWYKYVLPFMYVGDRRRNAVAAKTTSRVLREQAVENMVIIVEQRRIKDLRARLINLGFESVARASSGN